MYKLNFMVGLPRSGKDTFCEEWKKEKPNRVVVSGDHFRLAVYNKRFDIVGEELVRATMITAARALLLGGYEVMINDTNTSLTSINQILAIDKNAKCYYITTDAVRCCKRALKCGHDDLLPSIERMESNLVISLPLLKKLELEYVESIENAESSIINH